MINVQQTLRKGLFEWTELEVLSDHCEMCRAKQSGWTFKLRIEKLFGQFLDNPTVKEDTFTRIETGENVSLSCQNTPIPCGACSAKVAPQVPQAHVWESLLRNKNVWYNDVIQKSLESPSNCQKYYEQTINNAKRQGKKFGLILSVIK